MEEIIIKMTTPQQHLEGLNKDIKENTIRLKELGLNVKERPDIEMLLNSLSANKTQKEVEIIGNLLDLTLSIGIEKGIKETSKFWIEQQIKILEEEVEFLESLRKRNKNGIPTTTEQFKKIIEKRHTCEICKREDKIHDLDLHHIIPRRYGGKNKEDNLLLICGDCHKIIESMLYAGDITNRQICQERITKLNKEISDLKELK